ncbi:MAG TPA: A24 family peptidase [Candidatus Krumholzibacteria bacterium]|nr:A24 family peptidase [Candidatus Krumholzibacteria bacterium]
MTSDLVYTIAAGVFGLLIGSFLNVVIYRLPREMSFVGGRSMCPHCKQTIRWYNNIPLLSWVLLRGKCRACSARIPLRYPVVELLTGISAAGAMYAGGPTLTTLWVFAFIVIMIAITFIDWEHQIIPDPLSLGGTVLGWIGAAVCLPISLVQSIVGSVVGAGLILAIALLYKAARKVDGMGGGDVKLMAMIGAFLGWQMVFAVLFMAAFAGSVYGLFLLRRSGTSGKTAVAFGSFLAPAAILMWFAGERLMALYLGTLWLPK